MTSITSTDLLKVVQCAQEAHAWACTRACLVSFERAPKEDFPTQRPKNAQNVAFDCAHVAAELQEKLAQAGFQSVIHVLGSTRMAMRHCYVAVGSLVIDVRASHFKSDLAPITLMDRCAIDVASTPWWGTGTTVEDRAELIDFLSECGWPSDQIPQTAPLWH